jgi:hypothetical protein
VPLKHCHKRLHGSNFAVFDSFFLSHRFRNKCNSWGVGLLLI